MPMTLSGLEDQDMSRKAYVAYDFSCCIKTEVFLKVAVTYTVTVLTNTVGPIPETVQDFSHRTVIGSDI